MPNLIIVIQMISEGQRSLLILNTVVFGVILLYIFVFSIFSRLPATANEVLFVSIVIIDAAVLLYKSGASLNEYEKYFSGLGSGIAGCVLSALGMGIINFISLAEKDFYVYMAILTYSLFTGILYIVFNEIQRRKAN